MVVTYVQIQNNVPVQKLAVVHVVWVQEKVVVLMGTLTTKLLISVVLQEPFAQQEVYVFLVEDVIQRGATVMMACVMLV